ncbi:MAG: hypothetical protein K2M87_02755 [Muribaculaceae bacterium]|nr:hypothetical protein [Muribaculaceae bacterium]
MARNFNEKPTAPKGARIAFGIIMILIYIGVGLLCIFHVFDMIDYTVSCVVGGLLIAYGIFRGYRLYIGSN